jgi:hypothetical protein
MFEIGEAAKLSFSIGQSRLHILAEIRDAKVLFVKAGQVKKFKPAGKRNRPASSMLQEPLSSHPRSDDEYTPVVATKAITNRENIVDNVQIESSDDEEENKSKIPSCDHLFKFLRLEKSGTNKCNIYLCLTCKEEGKTGTDAVINSFCEKIDANFFIS